MPRYADIVAVRDALYEADAITMKGVRILNQFPTISPDEVRGAGEWILKQDNWWGDYAECSICHDEYTVPEGGLNFKFCPNCGSKMKGY